MVDADFEKDSRAHSFWEEWQAAADSPHKPDDNDLTAYLSSISEDWAYVLKDNAND